ncbi:unnamed protein product [Symbiodinium natans]|uniref:Uncharacterized protein n=1 Tax=Symbiodinium natans TaxID=878477 RepID=A0A812K6M6_9DINO|nr:unnamed protein product [Symbiodinium natans]
MEHSAASAQTDVHKRIVSRSLDFLARMDSAQAGRWEQFLPDWVAGVSSPNGPGCIDLKADMVDNLESAGRCDPSLSLADNIREVVETAASMFPSPPDGLDRFPAFSTGSRVEYVQHVRNQLHCGKLGLSDQISGGGTILAVGKKDSGKQREALGVALCLGALGSQGVSYAEIERCLEPQADAAARWLYPVSQMWLMVKLRYPRDLSMVFAAATDDVMIFSNAGPGVTAAAAERLDEAIVSHGVLKNAAKDVTDCLNATCVGVNLENGVQWAVPPECCLALIVCATELAARKEASPEQVLELLGCLRWYDLLRRQQLAAYQQVYKFTMHADSHQQPVPGEVIEELLLGTLLGIFWLTDLRKPTLDLIAASDASTVFGLGASVAKMPADQLRRLRRLAEKQGDYVFLEGTPLSQLPKRLGQAHCLGLKREDFVHVFSVRKPQAEAFVLLLRWSLRSRSRHASKVVIILDSAVWLGAASKGRSSTILNCLLRRAASLEMAADLTVQLILVTSAENPNDDPSRGVSRSALIHPSLPDHLIDCSEWDVQFDYVDVRQLYQGYKTPVLRGDCVLTPVWLLVGWCLLRLEVKRQEAGISIDHARSKKCAAKAPRKQMGLQGLQPIALRFVPDCRVLRIGRASGAYQNAYKVVFLAWVVLVLGCFCLVARLKMGRQCVEVAALRRFSPELARVTVLAAADAAPVLLCSVASLALEVDSLAAAVGSATFDLLCVFGATCAFGSGQTRYAMLDIAFEMLAIAEIALMESLSTGSQELGDGKGDGKGGLVGNVRDVPLWVQWALFSGTYGAYLCAALLVPGAPGFPVHAPVPGAPGAAPSRPRALGCARACDAFDEGYEVANEGHARRIRVSRPTRFREALATCEAEFRLEELTDTQDLRRRRRQHLAMVSRAAGIVSLAAILCLLLDSMSRLCCVAGAPPGIMAFIVLAAGLRMPRLLDAARAAKCLNNVENVEVPNLPSSVCSLLLAGALLRTKKEADFLRFEYLVVLVGAQLLYLLALLLLGRGLSRGGRLSVSFLLFASYLLCLTWVLARFYSEYSGRAFSQRALI